MDKSCFAMTWRGFSFLVVPIVLGVMALALSGCAAMALGYMMGKDAQQKPQQVPAKTTYVYKDAAGNTTSTVEATGAPVPLGK